MALKNRKERLEVRAHNLQQKDAEGNQSLVNKLKRRIRKAVKEHESLYMTERETSYK